MNKEEITMLGFEIVAYAGDARSRLLNALKYAEEGEYDKADELIKEADKLIVKAHNAQTDLLTAEASGEDLPFSVTLIHGQDHLMTTVLLKDMMKHIITLYKRSCQK